ncbi:MAG: redoxin domain-containing protein [Elusimicrobia bacterium]|nr:redoxin domain-containing protein [Elusimicrobiota bacterium]
MQKNSGKIVPQVIFVGLLALSCLPCRAGGFSPGDRAPDFELSDLTGKTISLSDILREDKPVVLSFFGTWCDSCLKEMNDLAEIAPKYNAAVYLVGVDADKDKLVRFVEKHKIPFPVLWDPKARVIGRKYDLFRGAFLVVPKVFIISPAGTIEYVSEAYDEARKTALKNKLAEVSAKKWRKLPEVAVFFTGSANGCLEPSYSNKQTYGGFVKLISFLKQQIKKYPSYILLDSGDFLPYAVSAAQADLALKAMGLAGYDAIAVGDQDLYFSGYIDVLRSGKLPFIASNVGWKADKSDSTSGVVTLPAGQADKTMVAGGIKIRIVSFISPETFSLYPETFTDKIGFRDLKEVLKGGKNADFLILLSHAGVEVNKKMAEEFKEFDLIIGGHSQELLNKPLKAGNALIIQSGSNLQHAGKIVLRFDGNKKLSNYDYEIAPLVNEIPDAPQIEALLKDYKNQVIKEP